MTMNCIASFLVLATTIILEQASAALPIQHLSKPTVLWNSAIQSPPGIRNIVQISPDDKWLYITTKDGELYKLDPENGDYRLPYIPEKRRDGVDGAEWTTYGGEGVAIHIMDDEEEEGEGSYLVYSVLDVNPKNSSPSTRVIAIEHDPESTELKVLWTKTLAGTLSGTPVIGSEGKFIYFTMNAPTQTLASPPPTTSPVAATISTNSPVTYSPTSSPVATNTSSTNSPVTNSPTISPVATNTTSTNATITNTPTISPVAVNTTSTNPPITDTPTISPVAKKDFFTISPVANNLFDSDEPASLLETNPAYWWAEDAGDQLLCVNGRNYPEEYLTNETLKNDTLFSTVEECCSANAEACIRERQREHQNPQSSSHRNLQATDRSGKLVILSHPLNGELIYEFDSRDEFSIQKHSFAPAGIARQPEFGNYNGGSDNTNDVIMWGSQPDNGEPRQQGETMLFQLPKGFNVSEVPVDISQFRLRVLESVSWTTTVRPTFSASGLDVYFAMSGNSFTGWNKGQRFDVVANLGPIPLPLPPDSDGVDSGASRPIVLADDDSLLLLGSTDHDTMFAADSESGGSEWMLADMGTNSLFTTPLISSDGDIAYFGKKNSVHAVNLTDGSQLWEDGFQHPSNTASEPARLAEFSLSSTGEFLYYARSGSWISAVRVANVIPTLSPLSPTSAPSSMPSSASSSSPSESVMPSTSLTPTISTSPSVDPDYVPPSSSPTLTILPSSSPSVSHSDSPSALSSNVPSLPPSITPLTTLAPLTSSPVVTEVVTEAKPSSSPIVTPPNASPPSSAAELLDSSSDENSSLSTTAIIGIAVGGGVGLILLLGIICYAWKKKKGEDDGVDINWQTDNANENVVGDEETKFQAGGGGDEEGEGQLRW
eukprot:CAMPEP_0172319398 /NCGR_PEP_ID=MMETSP1058-20130122/37541_1 /TAXON_ID=83371 /ORGANISM="Detonula confervacea, Strain CCMP 353" /LENGTH=883 /DNA_ID=CAMNT_0013034425 /DNA_START=65 /DNA_END=2713 /DNA_ORIENTATION=-